MNLVTSEQMREYDRLVIQEYGVPSIVLMENAAQRVAEVIRNQFSPLQGKPICIICGKGNNGGDGLAVARHLVTGDRATVTIYLVEPMEQASSDASINLQIARNYGIPIKSVTEPSALIEDLSQSYLIVDALLGTGVDGNPRPAAAGAIDAMNRAGVPIVSIDVPSGLNSDNGKAGNPTVQATVTITLAMPKVGLYLYPGTTLAGELVTVDIGFPPDLNSDSSVKTIAATKSQVAAWLPKRSAVRDSNKGKYGAVALLAGSPGFLGSACLAAEGAARSGAGLVTLAVPDSIFDSAMARAAEPIMTHSLKSSETGSFAASAAEAALQFVAQRTSVAFGCGAGHDDEIRAFAREFIAGCEKPLVIDADALTILSLEPDRGASLLKARKYPTVLTPHPGEMGRLLGINTADVQADRLKSVGEAARIFGAVVVLKGQASLVASPDGRLAVNTTGNPGMGTGGSGDVLSGVAATFLSQIDDPWAATVSAVFIHGMAGDIAAKELGEAGIIATDIATRLPAAIASCYE